MATPTQQPVVQKEQSMAMYDGESQQMGVGMMVTGPHKGQYIQNFSSKMGAVQSPAGTYTDIFLSGSVM